MSTQLATDYYELVSRLPPDSVLTLHGVSWEDYEDLLEQTREPAGLHISFDNGMLTIMTVSALHEST